MEADNGGWTMFFAYTHTPGSNFNLVPNTLPNLPSANSHVNLNDIGIPTIQVSEIRFMCIEVNKQEREKSKFWHFKSNNPGIIRVAMNGDQSVLNVKNKFKFLYYLD